MDADLPKTSWKRTRPLRVGDWDVRPASGEIAGRRGVQRLRPLLMDILLRLAAEPGQVVRREALLEDVWARRMVNDEVLSRAIAELRSALGDDARVARYIETLPKLGYRLVAAVGTPDGEPAAKPAPAGAAPGPPRRRAVIAIAIGAAIAIAVAVPWLASRRSSAGPQALEGMLVAARPLTSDPGLELGPRFSPDGRHVAFALAEENRARIVVQALEGGERRFIGAADRGLRLSPVFLPDGRRIAYWKGGAAGCGIVEHDLESGREKALVECGASPRPRFDLSADGRWLVFSAPPRDQYPAGLRLLDLERGAQRALTSPEPGMGDDLFPRFSPDGARIAFFRGNESHRALWSVERERPAGARAVSALEGLSYGAAWLGPDGPLLVAADWFGFRALNVIDLATGKARLAGARGARHPDVGPAGEIVYESAAYRADLWRMPAGGGEPTALWPSTRYTSQPEFSPDGRSVAFASNRDGLDAIYVAALDGEPRRIAGSARHRFLRPHWSADGRAVHAVRIAADREGAAIQEAVRIPVDGSAPVVIAPLGSAVNDVRESRDGRWLYWAELASHAMRLLRAPVGDPAKAERLPWPLVSHFQVNAERVVLAQPQLARLTSCRLDDLSCEPLAVELAPRDLYAWALGPRSLFVPSRAEGDARLVRFDLASGRTATIGAAGASAGTVATVSPDESVLLLVREEGPAIDLMIASP